MTLHRLLVAASLAVLAGLAAFTVVAWGIVPIKASSGHWQITAWFLEFSKRRSVAWHARNIEPLSLDEPWLALKGAGHYDTGCRPCHGSPDLHAPRIGMAMTPHPPALPEIVAKRAPEQLFYVVKHGIKFTGMPAWPSGVRDDEVRAMVAFLLALPQMDAAEYRRLVDGPAPPDDAGMPMADLADPAPGPPAAVLESCARCHGIDGRGRGTDAFPSLAGQRREYLINAMHAYTRGTRHSGIMQPVAASVADPDVRAIADYYSRLPARPAGTGADADAIARGAAIAQRGIPDQGVPSCLDCHGPREGPINPAYPRLAGQYADYLLLQLRLFRDGHRGGSAYAHLMDHVAPRLTDAQMRDVAAYYASLPGAGR